MKYNIYLIIAVFLLLLHPVSSQRVVDFDKDSIPDNQDKYPFDYDNDGLPDNWEKTHNGLRWDINDAHLDRDNDGISNLQEYRKSLIREPSIGERLKNIPLEIILLIVLIIGISLIAIGIILHLHKKRKQPKILRPPRQAVQGPAIAQRRPVIPPRTGTAPYHGPTQGQHYVPQHRGIKK